MLHHQLFIEERREVEDMADKSACYQESSILEEHRREGFEVANADAIFESTNLART